MRFKHKNCKIEYEKNEDAIVIECIRTKKNKRGRGDAKEAMNLFLKKYKNERIEAHVYPQDEATDLSRLLKFYENLGFEVLNGDQSWGYEIAI